MAASNNVTCGICQAQHVVKDANVWCPECEEGLCSECQKYHKISKSSRNHVTLPVENYKKIPASVSSITNNCEEHHMTYQNYCPKHEKLCCPMCISSDHSKCVDLKALSEIIHSSKSSTLIENIEDSLQVIRSNIDKAIKDREENMKTIQEQRQKFHVEIKRMRDQINSHLDNLEQNLMKKLNEAIEMTNSKLSKLIGELNEKKRSVEELQNNMSALKAYGSNLQTFIGGKIIETDVTKEEQYLIDLSESENLHNLDLSCHIEDTIKDLVTSIQSFGSVSVNVRAPNVFLTGGQDKKAQMRTSSSSRSIHDIQLVLKSKFQIPTKEEIVNLYEGVVCSDGRMVFADECNGKLIVVNQNCKLVKEISCSGYKPRYIAVIDGSTIAVLTDGNTQVININTEKTEKKYSTGTYCYGLIYSDGRLIYTRPRDCVESISLSTGEISSLINVKMEYWSNLASHGDKIYLCDHGNDTVICYTTSGKKLWSFCDKTVMRNPRYMAVDNSYNVYVTSSDSHGIAVLSPDGKFGKKLTSSEDGQKYLRGIYFDQKTNTLLRTNSDGMIYLYNIV